MAFQSTLPTRGSDTCAMPKIPIKLLISIHAPHEGERRRTGSTSPPHRQLFQSTLPTRGSDIPCGLQPHGTKISIHAPHEGERLSVYACTRPHSTHFNPRSPRGGATIRSQIYSCNREYFNPRSPRGGATTVYYKFDNAEIISIHAPHEGERQAVHPLIALRFLISIHAPHEGERLTKIVRIVLIPIFQSTLPTRGSDFIRCG